jgi:glutathionyl-hydroquinone reductase
MDDDKRRAYEQSQEAYDEAVRDLYGALERLEGLLAGGQRFLLGDQMTEADVRLFQVECKDKWKECPCCANKGSAGW